MNGITRVATSAAVGVAGGGTFAAGISQMETKTPSDAASAALVLGSTAALLGGGLGVYLLASKVAPGNVAAATFLTGGAALLGTALVPNPYQ